MNACILNHFRILRFNQTRNYPFFIELFYFGGHYIASPCIKCLGMIVKSLHIITATEQIYYFFPIHEQVEVSTNVYRCVCFGTLRPIKAGRIIRKFQF